MSSRTKHLTVIATGPRTERLFRKDRLVQRLLYPEKPEGRPRTRAECADVPRPCPFVGCRHNLYLDIARLPAIRYTFPDREPWDMPPNRSCVLDIADEGPHTLEEIGEFTNVSRERARQVELDAVQQLKRRLS